jgi:putative MATE family efflux protein
MDTSLTEGRVGEGLLRYSLPLLASELVQRLCALADSVIAGKLIGEYALSAIGSVLPVTVVFSTIAIGFGSGCSIIVSRLYGKKDKAAIKMATRTAALSALAICVVLESLGLVFSRSLVAMVNAPDELLGDARDYLEIYVLSFAFRFALCLCIGIFNAFGNSRLSLLCLSLCSACNVILDIVLVSCWGLGVRGIALASLASQAVMAAAALWMLVGKLRAFEGSPSRGACSLEMLREIYRLCMPSIAQQAILSLGDVYMLRVINGYGLGAMTGYNAALQLNLAFFTCVNALGTGLSCYTAQNMGMYRPDRVEKGLVAGIAMSLGAVVPFTFCLFLFPETFLSLFLGAGSDRAFSIGSLFLRLTSPFFLVVSVKQLIDGVLRGSGAMSYPLWITVIDLAQRVLLLFVLPLRLGLAGVFITFPTGWSLSAILYFAFYRRGVWREKGVNMVGAKDCITDVEGILVGQESDLAGLTGCTVVLCPEGAICGIDIRGGSPGTRECSLLDPIMSVERVHAVFMAGGSSRGLGAADGIVQYLEERGIGFASEFGKIPIVPGAVIFDLSIGSSAARPTREMAYKACLNAKSDKIVQGNAGAGTGATVGKALGFRNCMKGGVGSSSMTLKNGLTVGAIVTVNSFGEIIDDRTHETIAGVLVNGAIRATDECMFETGDIRYSFNMENTTLATIATNARLDKVGCCKVAQMASAGLARAIHPFGTTLDGDTTFMLSMGDIECDINVIGTLAGAVAARAVSNAIKSAVSAGGVKAYRDIAPR